VDSYSPEIIDCRIYKDHVIYKIKEIHDSIPVYALKVFDYKRNILMTYFEFDQLVISGDKRFVWLPLKDKVYNIDENLSTLFLWAGGQYATCGFDNMDNFLVSKDCSIMSTQGFLNLAFDFTSSCVHDDQFHVDLFVR
jgi:hypothetical protein